MNIRKSSVNDLIVNKLEKLDVQENSLIILRFDALKIGVQMAEELGRDVLKAMQSIGMNKSILILPDGISVEQIPETIMNNTGWKKA